MEVPLTDRGVAVYDDLRAAATAAAELVVGAARDAIARRGRFVIALAGGETPRSLYSLLATDYRAAVPWDGTDVCFGDERCVPPHSPASNFRLAWTTLLDKVPIVEQRVHRIFGELGPDAAARDYDTRMRQLFQGDAEEPTFDVALLGVGADGHTASLFPGDPALDEQSRWATAVFAPPHATSRERVTLTLPVLNRARTVLVLTAGSEKREVVSEIVLGKAPELPAARVQGLERTLWLLDRTVAP